MAAAVRGFLQSWARNLYRPLTGFSRAASTTIPVKLPLLERGLLLSSLSLLAIEAYRWKSKRVLVYASMKVEDLKEQADYLYGSGETEKLYAFLSQFKNSEDPELLWRLARASRDLAQLSKTAPDEKKRLVYESRDLAKRALELNESCSAAHKWYGICLSDVGDYEGIKVKIGNSYIIRDHFQGNSLQPKITLRDYFQKTMATSTSLVPLESLRCYMFADLPWYQSKIAAALFAAPPSSTFEEALIYFEKAEEVDPNFYSKNLLFLGKTFLKLKNNELALHWLHKARDYPARTEEDKEVLKEATALLKSLGEKV